MAGRGDIKAGKAFVELSLKNAQFTKGLKQSGELLKSFGKNMTIVGGAISAAGAAALAPLIYAVKKFADTGSELHDMAQRTGVAAGALAELGYAAEQSGASMESVEKSLKKSQQFMGKAAAGSKEARKQIAELGLNFGNLAHLKPEDQFTAIGEAISKLPPGFKQTSAAMAVFGKAGTELLPMLSELNDLRKEARSLGIGMTPEDAKAADKLGDAFGKLVGAISAVAMKIGSALAPEVTAWAEVVTKVVVSVGRWVKENGALFVTIAKVAAIMVAAGGAIIALGSAVTFIGFALTGIATIGGTIATVFSALSSVVAGAFAAILSPIGLVVAAIVALVGYFLWSSGEIGKAVDSINGLINDMGDIWTQTFKGISDAIAAGNLGLAMEIAWTGIKLAFATGSKWVMDKWDSFIGYLEDAWAVCKFTLASISLELWGAIQKAWEAGKTAAMNTTIEMAQGVIGIMDKMPDAVQAMMGWKKGTGAAMPFLKVGVGAAGKGAQDKIDQETTGGQRILAEDMVRGMGKRMTARGESAKGRQDQIDALQAELNAKGKTAADEAWKVRTAAEREKKAAGVTPEGGAAMQQDIIGTFSAAGAAAAGGAGGGQLAETKKTNAALLRLERLEREKAKRNEKILRAMMAREALNA